MAWIKKGTATGSGDDFDTGVLTATIFNQILFHLEATGGTGINAQNRIGSTTVDSGNNYAWRYSINGGADATSASRDYIKESAVTTDSGETGFRMLYIINISSEEKLIIGFSVDVLATGAATAPSRTEIGQKWVNTSNQFDIVGGHNNSGTGDFSSDTNISVLGTD